MEKKSFKNWKAQQVEKAFGIQRTWVSDVLDRWLKNDLELSEREHHELRDLQQLAYYNIDAWNEAALKFLFIAPLVYKIDFQSSKNYKGFLEQTLIVENDEVIARGNVDYMIATGRETPEAPFYLLHEYKPETTAVLDPKGQLIIAMLAAQRANVAAGLTQPVYGSYVLGRLWFMVILNGENYTISQAYDCTHVEGLLKTNPPRR